MTRLAGLRKWVLRPLLVATVVVAAVVGWNFLTGNFGATIPGRVYRSAQLRAGDLARKVDEHRVKTVVNLRGHHPDQPWYRAERDASLAHGATQVDIPLSSCEWMSRTQMRTLVDVLRTCETPVLVHCWRGSERTGLASAFAILLREGSTLDEARGQFSLGFLFVRAGDGVVTIEHFEQYESWLKANGMSHTPGSFLRWADSGYVPGKPSREDWPYDPEPLVVMTRPTPGGPAERKVWDPRGVTSAEAARRDRQTSTVK